MNMEKKTLMPPQSKLMPNYLTPKIPKIVPVTKLNLVTVLGLGRSGKAKKVDVPQRPSEIMANNHMGRK